MNSNSTPPCRRHRHPQRWRYGGRARPTRVDHIAGRSRARARVVVDAQRRRPRRLAAVLRAHGARRPLARPHARRPRRRRTDGSVRVPARRRAHDARPSELVGRRVAHAPVGGRPPRERHGAARGAARDAARRRRRRLRPSGDGDARQAARAAARGAVGAGGRLPERGAQPRPRPRAAGGAALPRPDAAVERAARPRVPARGGADGAARAPPLRGRALGRAAALAPQQQGLRVPHLWHDDLRPALGRRRPHHQHDAARLLDAR